MVINLKIASQLFSCKTARYFSVSKYRRVKLVQFVYKNNPNEIKVGYLKGSDTVDICKVNPTLPKILIDIVKNGDVKEIMKLESNVSVAAEPASSILLKAPIHGMDKILCIGLNYKDHCKEQKLTIPKVPMIFSKFASTIIGPTDFLRLRTDTVKNVDWEVELALVIGKKASRVKAAQALNYVLGYTVAQDISGRDWQREKNGGQFLLGKSMDTFCPIGPCIVTADEINDPQNLNIKCSVNGKVKQDSNTNQLVHKIPDVIERLTYVMTLLPGDIILTGTPGGVGASMKPPEFLKPGDVIHSEIEKIGILETKVEKF